MVQTPAKPETETLSLNLPKHIKLYVTQDQFAALAASNRELRLGIWNEVTPRMALKE